MLFGVGFEKLNRRTMRKFRNVLRTSLTRISSSRWQADPDSCRVIGIDTEIALPKARERGCGPVKSLDLKFERRRKDEAGKKREHWQNACGIQGSRVDLWREKRNGSVPPD